MKINRHLLQINRNILIGFIASASVSAIAAELLSGYENYLITILTIIIGYITYFGIFSVLFYSDNRKRYRTMKGSLIRKELLKMVSSFGVGEIIYLAIRGPTMLYFLEIGMQPSIASVVSEIIATGFYMASVTIFLKKAKTF